MILYFVTILRSRSPAWSWRLQLDLARAEQRRTYTARHRKTSCERPRRRGPKQEIVL